MVQYKVLTKHKKNQQLKVQEMKCPFSIKTFIVVETKTKAARREKKNQAQDRQLGTNMYTHTS